MKYSVTPEPLPTNPYKLYAVVIAVIGITSLITLAYGGWVPSRSNMIPFMIGVLGLTVAFIFGIGVIFGSMAFERRFGGGKVIAFWKIEGQEWKAHVEKSRKSLRKKFWLIFLPPVAMGGTLLLAASDGKLTEIFPYAIGGLVLMTAVIAVILFLQWLSFSGKNGNVWLSRKGVLVNRRAFFSNSLGVMLREATVLEEGERLVLFIRYEVRSKNTVGSHELVIPVPHGERKLVEDTVADWG